MLLVAFCGFLFFYGLGAFGLMGADEPRYAQIAREMMERGDWVTPTLQGKPWLEKPVLYYWEAALSFRALGVSDRAARVPGAVDAALLVAALYFFLRRFRPGSEFDGALITASCAGIVGFARAASTDMPLTACFAIALLCWYAWYENRRRIELAAFYAFMGIGTLAKGPVALALPVVIVFLFVAIKREWRVIGASLWLPGVALYLAVTLPWYVLVQHRNPEFFRFFILEHNFARFSQNVYHHPQPFWFYLPVFLLATMPWTLVLILAFAERARLVWCEGKEAFSNPEDSWVLFLWIWMLVPVLFFSASRSKLPGYILPAVPAGGLLVAEFVAGRRVAKNTSGETKLSLWFAAGHGIVCGVLIFAALTAAPVALNRYLIWDTRTWVAAAAGAVCAAGIVAALRSGAGIGLISRATTFAVVVSIAAVIRFAAPALDATQSARPIAANILAFSREPVPVALYHLSREQKYGLEFYLNRAAAKYEDGNIPAAPHVVVAAQGAQTQVAEMVPGRKVSYLTRISAEKVELYWVGKP